MIVGYVRVSDKHASAEQQVTALHAYGCDEIFTDHAVTVRDPRPGLNQCLSKLSRGDTLVVYRLDRLGRSIAELITVLDHLSRLGVGLVSVEDAVSTLDPIQRAVFDALISAQDALRSERSIRSIEKARREGRVGGRRPALTDEQVTRARQAHADGVGLKALARQYDVAYNTIKAAVRGHGIYAQNVRTPSDVADKRTSASVEDTSARNTTQP